MEIIPAHPDMAATLTEITLAAKGHWNYPERWMQLWVPELTITENYITGNESWVARVDGVIAAWYSLQEADGDLWLDNLWVLPAFIGRGVGKGLFMHAVERSRLRNVSVLKITADPNAEPFYQQMGAQKVGEKRGEVEGVLRILPVLEIKL